MPAIMSLEGPRLSHLDSLRGQLYAATPRKWWRALGELPSLSPLDTIKAHPWAFFGLLVGGAWLAGSKTGQRLLSKK